MCLPRCFSSVVAEKFVWQVRMYKVKCCMVTKMLCSCTDACVAGWNVQVKGLYGNQVVYVVQLQRWLCGRLECTWCMCCMVTEMFVLCCCRIFCAAGRGGTRCTSCKVTKMFLLCCCKDVCAAG